MADLSSSSGSGYSSSGAGSDSSSRSSSRSSSLGRHRNRHRHQHRHHHHEPRLSRSLQRQQLHQQQDDSDDAVVPVGHQTAGPSVVLPMSVIITAKPDAAIGNSSLISDSQASTSASVPMPTAWPESLIVNCSLPGSTVNAAETSNSSQQHQYSLDQTCLSKLAYQQAKQQQQQQPTMAPVAMAGPSSGSACGVARPKYPLQDDSEYSSYESLLGAADCGGGRGRSTSSKPFCRICHLPGDECASGAAGDVSAASAAVGVAAGNRLLLSPCRCSGTLQHVHPACLAKWIEASARIRRSMDPAAEAERRRRNGGRHRNGRSPPRCELCNYEYRRRVKFSLAANGGWRFPRVSRGDRVLHLIFLLCLIVMTACAVITVMCFVRDRDRPMVGGQQQQQTHLAVGSAASLPSASSSSSASLTPGEAASKQQPQHPHQSPPTPLVLTSYEALTLVSGILFFLAFFTAMSVQIKSRHTVYKLMVKCYRMNITYSFLPYERARDQQCA